MFDDESRGRLFPSLQNKVYLNTAAEGIPPDCSREALSAYHNRKTQGMAGRDGLFEEFETCRRSVAELLKLTPGEVSFCSSSSEAYNLLASAIDLREGGEVVITDLDFPAGATPWLQLPSGPKVSLWENREGALELDDLAPLLSEKTRLVQVSLVSFLTGYRIPWAAFRDMVRQKAPQAILAVDVTQAAGRIVLDCLDADCIIASSYKWLLGSHGGCVVAVPDHAREKVVVRAGGWYHLANAFDSDRFSRAEPYPGARGFSVGMPAFPSIYALRSGVDCLNEVGVPAIAEHSDRLVEYLHDGLAELGIKTMSPSQPGNCSGIISFQSKNDAALNQQLLSENIHVMHQAGRLRISVHGYNRLNDIEQFLASLSKAI
tara:strand:- start:4303 stop:5427 length:1125 start_codon:yes stop_codon:yes gene_type:complete